MPEPATPEAGPTAKELRAVFDHEVQRSLRAVLAAASLIYGAFTVLDLAVYPPAMAAADAAATLLLAVAWFATGRFPVPARWANAAMAAVALVVVAEGAFSLLYTRDPLQTVGFLLLAMGAGVFLLSHRWLAAVLGLALAGWTAAAVAVGDGGAWSQFGLTLLSACALAAVVHALRLGALTRLEGSRRREARHAADLERALEAARRSEEALAESREKFRSIVETAPNFILTVDRAGRILYINRTLPSMRAEDVLGRTIAHFVGRATSTDVDEALTKVFDEERDVSFEVAHTDPLGTTRWFELHVAPVRRGARVEEATVVALDITERRQAEEAQRVAFERLAEINRLKEIGELKTRLLNTASHELNTPITPLKLQIHLLRSERLGELNDRQRKAVEMLDRNVERLSSLVQDVLDVARLQSGNLRLRKDRVDLDALVRDVVDAYEEPARQAGVQLAVSAKARRPVLADADRVTQVLYNLVGNALKFTPAGGRIAVETAEERERVVVRVRDTGVGLTAEQVSRLFQPFGQVHDPADRTRAGTGLGLYICKGILEQHGGRIWCESRGPGEGSTFAFALPVDGRALTVDPAAEPAFG